MSEPAPSRDLLEAELAERVDRACDAFELAWKSPTRPCVEDSLGEMAEPGRSVLLRELLKLDVEYRRMAGELPTPREYQDRFPTHADLMADLFQPAPLPATERGQALVTPSETFPRGSPPPLTDKRLPVVPGYEMLEKLGYGGMGVVYKARQLGLNRLVALKMILSGPHAGDAELRLFRLEAESVARLDHPNIVRVHHPGEHEGQPYFSMEFIEGGSLADWLARHSMPPEDAARLVETLARAIHYAHGQGVAHRDLKPANVLLTTRESERPEGSNRSPSRLVNLIPKITDFGLAKKLDSSTAITQSGGVKGTPSYIAPEVVSGKVHDRWPATDVYGLGAILYELLSGCPPFVGDSPLDTLEMVRTQEPVAPRQHRPVVMPVLEAICLKCLEKDPERRYESAEHLSDDLAAYLRGDPIALVPVSEWDRQAAWARKAGYELVELIGCSSLGLIFTARKLTLLSRLVTLKTFSALNQLSEDRMERFLAEAEVAARLHHSGIEQIYDRGECQGRHYCAVEYVEGGRLADRHLGNPQSTQEAATLIQALAEAVHFAHQEGILHGDLRPSNVLLTRDGKPRITGFGLPRLLQGQRAGQRLPDGRRPSGYIAPEQVRGEPIGRHTDLYSLGAIFYELLTGESPFPAETIDEMLQQIEDREPVPPGQRRSDVPSVVEQICLRCLHKDPEQRYASAQELADDLRRWLRGQQPITDVFNLIPGYRIEREIGRGGLGIVHEATKLNLDLRVALKIFNAGSGRVLKPIRSVARLKHPNLVMVYDCGERDGRVYVAEELIEGTSLEKLMAAGPQPPRDAARLMETLARTLHYVHVHGIVHRNLKPRVVLLGTPPAGTSADHETSSWGILKLSSFDLAVLTGDPTREEDNGEIVGTPRYMSPEQATGQPGQIGPATDIHALGILLYELLTGQPLFEGDTPQALINQVSNHVPRSPGQVRPGIPQALNAICLKCLTKEPGRRYVSAMALADELHQFLTRRGGLMQRVFGWVWGKS